MKSSRPAVLALMSLLTNTQSRDLQVILYDILIFDLLRFTEIYPKQLTAVSSSLGWECQAVCRLLAQAADERLSRRYPLLRAHRGE